MSAWTNMSLEAGNKRRQADFYDVCRICPNGCCIGARPPLTPRRRRVIGNFLQQNGIAVDTPFENGAYMFPRETDDGCCIFLNKNAKKCLIHSVKPETCVAGPITFDINAETGKLEWFLKTSKICSLAGFLYKDRESYSRHEKSAKREIRRLVQELDAEALRAILTIDEPDTVKMGEDDVAPEVLAKLKL